MFKKIIGLIILICFFPGCASLSLHYLADSGPRNCTKTSSDILNDFYDGPGEMVIAGYYLGTVIIDEEKHYHYVFRRGYGTWNVEYTEVFLSSDKAPILKFKNSFKKIRGNPDTLLYIHRVEPIRRVEPDSKKVMRAIQRSFLEETSSILCFSVTKDMIESEIFVGVFQGGNYVWSPPFSITENSVQENKLLINTRNFLLSTTTIFYVLMPVALVLDCTVLLPVNISMYLGLSRTW